MQLRLIREPTAKDTTLGVLFVDGVFFCWTLEDAIRDDKIPHQTCIPPGRYDVVLSHSPRFNRVLPEVLNVPNFTGIRIHAGNDIADTDGCILVGEERGDAEIYHSRPALAHLQSLMDAAVFRGDRISLFIENP